VCVWSVQNIWDLSISEVGVGSLSNRLHRESDKWAWLITTPNKLIGARICKPKCVTTLSNSHLGVAKINLVGRPHSRSLTRSRRMAHTLKPLQGLAD
jgi:hypothetical protein